MKFFLDACMPYSSKEIFQRYGEVSHARDIGMGGAPDKEIIEYASKNKAVLVTKDLDFGNTLLYPIDSYFGVIILRVPFYFTAKQINNVLREFLSSVNIEELKNAITIVELGRYRMRR